MSKLTASHRYDLTTLAAFPPWWIRKELVVQDLLKEGAKIVFFYS